MKKYNPVFPEQYKSNEFNLPNLVVIVDDAVRKDIDVCKGAVGWRNQEKGVEVFYLYDEAISFSGLRFVPAAICDAVYYVDPQDRTRFIRLDCYFDKMQESRLAELQDIAYCLGAKQYNVEMEENLSTQQATTQKASVKKKDGFGLFKGKVEALEEREVVSKKISRHKSVAHAEFVGERKIKEPELHWFAHDDNIRNLIKMRCATGNDGEMKIYTMQFKGSDFATLGASTAAKIDAAMGKISAGSDFKLQSKATKESQNNLIYEIEF